MVGADRYVKPMVSQDGCGGEIIDTDRAVICGIIEPAIDAINQELGKSLCTLRSGRYSKHRRSPVLSIISYGGGHGDGVIILHSCDEGSLGLTVAIDIYENSELSCKIQDGSGISIFPDGLDLSDPDCSNKIEIVLREALARFCASRPTKCPGRQLATNSS